MPPQIATDGASCYKLTCREIRYAYVYKEARPTITREVNPDYIISALALSGHTHSRGRRVLSEWDRKEDPEQIPRRHPGVVSLLRAEYVPRQGAVGITDEHVACQRTCPRTQAKRRYMQRDRSLLVRPAETASVSDTDKQTRTSRRPSACNQALPSVATLSKFLRPPMCMPSISEVPRHYPANDANAREAHHGSVSL